MVNFSRRGLLHRLGCAVAVGSAPGGVHAGSGYAPRRLVDRPIITPGMDARMGADIEGPSLIAAPPWLRRPLGRYYLYFADHKGSYIRLAAADRLEGPWRVHAPGVLPLARSGLLTAAPQVPTDAASRPYGLPGAAPAGTPGVPTALEDATLPHLASPDVHVDAANRRIVMYYHGLTGFGRQQTRVAASLDGLDFRPVGGILGPPYMRVFRYGGWTYGLAMPGLLLRSPDGVTDFRPGPQLFGDDQRHTAVLLRGSRLHVFWTRVGDAPERVYASTIDLRSDWMAWRASQPVEVLRAARPWEGGDLPVEPSYRSAIYRPVNQIRDPAIFEEHGRTYLLYAVKGEGGIGIAEITVPH